MKKVKNKSQIPALTDVSPSLVRLLQQKTELVSTRSERERELSRREAAYAHDKQATLSDADKRARRILGDSELDKIDASQQVLADLRREIGDIGHAINLLRCRIDEEKSRASRVVCEHVQGQYCERVAEMCACAIALYESAREYNALTSALQSEGVSWTMLNPMVPNFLGNLSDNHSSLAWFLKDAVQHGFIARDAVPEPIRQ